MSELESDKQTLISFHTNVPRLSDQDMWLRPIIEELDAKAEKIHAYAYVLDTDSERDLISRILESFQSVGFPHAIVSFRVNRDACEDFLPVSFWPPRQP